MTIFEEAIRFAAERHSGMMRKRQKTPYILHPMEAAAIIGTMCSDEEVLAAAMLHDTVEDTDTTMAELEERFGPRVASLVASETEDKMPSLPPEESWPVRKAASLEKLAAADDPAVKMLWLGDKLSNMRAFYRGWRAEGIGSFAHFNQTDPGRQAWYYRTIEALLSDLSEYDAWQEYHFLVETVFAGISSVPPEDTP